MNGQSAHLPRNLDYGILHDLSGHLLRHAFNRGQDVFAATFGDEDITPLRFMIMELVARNPDISHREICAAMDTAAPVITTSIKPLLTRDFLEAHKNKEDKRRLQYRITEKGNTWQQEQAGLIQQSEDRLLQNLTTQEQTELNRLLLKLTGIRR